MDDEDSQHRIGSYAGMNSADIKTIIAVDPGLSGGIAVWKKDHQVAAFPMSETKGDVAELLQSLVVPGQTVAFIEEVSGFIGREQPGSRMFRFGRSFGFALGVLQGLNVRVELARVLFNYRYRRAAGEAGNNEPLARIKHAQGNASRNDKRLPYLL